MKKNGITGGIADIDFANKSSRVPCFDSSLEGFNSYNIFFSVDPSVCNVID
ncbi:hypothetical protein J2787_004061 [Chryseobacterium rhizosphaerae]|uniref:Uncharacterized protein n=1 Tax=Chryseobacterium rhizosphaerae TaxID=395937 RepID=A0AAE3YBM8_9FLAO|nr:hypothetical protein [Chryseobacterium rhizosphaerae]